MTKSLNQWALWVMLIPSLGYGIWKSWPVSIVRHQIRDSDVHISIRIGNIFEQEGALIIGTNSTFDTTLDDGVISPDSIQGQFTRKYFAGNVAQLDRQLDEGLSSIEALAHRNTREKPFGKRTVYPMGTVVPVHAGNRKAYFYAMAHLNAHKSAHVEPEEFLDALPRLWQGIRDRGDMEDNLLCPLLGAKHGRLKTRRVALIAEIVRSFVVASRNGPLVDNITIVVSRRDVKQGQIDLGKMERVLEWECSTTRELRVFDDSPLGHPIGRKALP